MLVVVWEAECSALQPKRLLIILLAMFSSLSESPVTGSVWLLSSELHKP